MIILPALALFSSPLEKDSSEVGRSNAEPSDLNEASVNTVEFAILQSMVWSLVRSMVSSMTLE